MMTILSIPVFLLLIGTESVNGQLTGQLDSALSIAAYIRYIYYI